MTKEQKIYDGERTVSSVNSVGKMQHAKKKKEKKETRSLSHNIHKNIHKN